MNKLVLGIAALPFLAAAASASQPLSDAQMDTVTAGFASISDADAQALGKIVASATATLSQVNVVTTTTGTGTSAVTTPVTSTFGETTLTLIKSLSAAQSASSASNTLPTTVLPITTTFQTP
jgi:CBS domain containing-hemolysin-like protein